MGSWDLPVMKLYPVRLYHPIKQIKRHQYYREVIHSQNNDYCIPVENTEFHASAIHELSYTTIHKATFPKSQKIKINKNDYWIVQI